MTNRETLTRFIEEENGGVVFKLKASKGFGNNAERIFYAYSIDNNGIIKTILKQDMLLSEFEQVKRDYLLEELLNNNKC